MARRPYPMLRDLPPARRPAPSFITPLQYIIIPQNLLTLETYYNILYYQVRMYACT